MARITYRVTFEFASDETKSSETTYRITAPYWGRVINEKKLQYSDTLTVSPSMIEIEMSRNDQLTSENFLEKSTIRQQLTKALVFMDLVFGNVPEVTSAKWAEEGREPQTVDLSKIPFIKTWKRSNGGCKELPLKALNCLFPDIVDFSSPEGTKSEGNKSFDTKRDAAKRMRIALYDISASNSLSDFPDCKFRLLYSGFNAMLALRASQDDAKPKGNRDADMLNLVLKEEDDFPNAFSYYEKLDSDALRDNQSHFVDLLEWRACLLGATDLKHWFNRGKGCDCLNGDSIVAAALSRRISEKDNVSKMSVQDGKNGESTQELRQVLAKREKEEHEDTKRQFLFVLRNYVYQKRCRLMHGAEAVEPFSFISAESAVSSKETDSQINDLLQLTIVDMVNSACKEMELDDRISEVNPS